MPNRQLTIWEWRADSTHALTRCRPLSDGWRAECACGWMSTPQTVRALAEYRWRAHLLDTPQGRTLAGVLHHYRHPDRD